MISFWCNVGATRSRIPSIFFHYNIGLFWKISFFFLRTFGKVWWPKSDSWHKNVNSKIFKGFCEFQLLLTKIRFVRITESFKIDYQLIMYTHVQKQTNKFIRFWVFWSNSIQPKWPFVLMPFGRKWRYAEKNMYMPM